MPFRSTFLAALALAAAVLSSLSASAEPGTTADGRYTIVAALAGAPPTLVAGPAPVLAGSRSEASPTARGRSGLPWLTGVFVGPTNVEISSGDNPSPRVLLERIRKFDAWRGRPSDVALQFISYHYFTRDYPAFLQAPALTANLAAFRQAGLVPILSVPLVTQADAGRFAHVAAGKIDRHHRAVAQRLRQIMGRERIYLRLGWEGDYGYPWSVSGHEGAGQPDPAVPANYIAAWRRVAKIYREAVPGALMVWNCVKRPRVAWAAYYPGNDVVDIVSIDLYDNGTGGYFTADNAAWRKLGLGSYDTATGRLQGLRGVLDFARSRGKKIAVDEWGATNSTLRASDPANNGFFAAAVFDFLMANRAHVAYELYFNTPGRHQIHPLVAHNRRVSAAYLSRWRP
jgi:hypothetical protein